MWSSGAGKFSKRPSLHSRTNFPAGCAARARNSMENNRNFLITIALSVLILTLWQVFYMNPRIEREREVARIEAERVEAQKPTTPAAGGTDVPTPAPGSMPGVPGAEGMAAASREQAIA